MGAAARRPGDMKLSKTNYLVYRDCAHNAWMKVHRPDAYAAEPLSVFDQAIIETGNDVDVRARALFPDGVLIRRGDAGGDGRTGRGAYAGALPARIRDGPLHDRLRHPRFGTARGAGLRSLRSQSLHQRRRPEGKDDLYALTSRFKRWCFRSAAFRSGVSTSCASTALTCPTARSTSGSCSRARISLTRRTRCSRRCVSKWTRRTT